jgi:hypothetical protein
MSISRMLGAPIFAVIAIVQAVRFVQRWPVSIDGYPVPLSFSAVAAVAFAILSYLHWRDGAPRNRS